MTIKFDKSYCLGCDSYQTNKKLRHILEEIAKTIQISYQQGKTDAVAYTCLNPKKVYELLLSVTCKDFT